MKRITILLTCVITLEAARYGDYSGAQMPNFGIAYDNKDSGTQDDDSDRSPDAAPSFDYKYEETPRNKIDTQDREDEDAWQTRSKKRHKSTDDTEEFYSDDHEIVPKFKSKRRFQKHRPRMKDVYKDNKRKSVEYDEITNDEADNIDSSEYINKQRLDDDNRIDEENFGFRYTTRKIARRKPRDRTISRERLRKYLPGDEINLKDRESDVETDDYQRRPHGSTLERTHTPYLDLDNLKHNNYPEYEDTLRFNTIRNKLPGLFRQTKASSSDETPSTRTLQDISYRRANVPEKISEVKLAAEPSSKSTTESITTVSTRQSTDQNLKPTLANSTELSLAEKSRLSILRKAQKKEGSHNVSRTTKPPVLMQVTKQMQTVVMIESPNKDLHLRAREIFEDSPERLNRAKKLMRRKLVAGARNINDLIDNWDEMVCDYIDTSLLDSGLSRVRVDLKLIMLSVINYLLFI